MQFRITLKVLKKRQLLPLSYQYELSSWIYKLIYSGDNEFATFLHERGYDNEKKRFKFFTFSRLHVPVFDRIDDRMEINCDRVSFVISFFVDAIAQKMILGIFENQRFRLGDRITQVDFKVESINELNLEISSTKVKLKTTSPLVVVEYKTRLNGTIEQKYLHPKNSKFEECFVHNLVSKYKMACQHDLIESINFEEKDIKIKIISSKIKKKAMRIKAHTKAETTVIGYLCAFELTAPKTLIELGILGGFGRMNAEGFGATEIVE